MAPRVAAAVERAALRFQDQAGYAAAVLGSLRQGAPPLAHVAPLHPVEPALVTTSSVAAGLVSVAGALLLAGAALYWRRLPWLKHGHEPGAGLTVVTRRFQSGVINDYVTWLVLG